MTLSTEQPTSRRARREIERLATREIELIPLVRSEGLAGSSSEGLAGSSSAASADTVAQTSNEIIRNSLDISRPTSAAPATGAAPATVAAPATGAAPAEPKRWGRRVKQTPVIQKSDNRLTESDTTEVLPASDSRPTGHWANQLDSPKETRMLKSSISKIDSALESGSEASEASLTKLDPGGSSVGTTTSTLILPNLPGTISSVNASAKVTGDIFRTGAINLPDGFGSTGVIPTQVDTGEVDRLIDLVEDVDTGLNPVSAQKAIAGLNYSGPELAEPQKDRVNLPLIFALVIGGLAILTVGAFLVGALLKLY